nr:HepT-like ribonuclease domain-containing protein [uncultured Selenomonas sp.]
MIAGLRHRLVHDYDGTNWNIISDVVFEELPILIEQLRLRLTENENTDDVG